MLLHPNLPTSLLFIITCLITLFHIPTSFSQENQRYVDCNQNFECGDIDLGYPFWGEFRPNYCGAYPGFNLRCEDNNTFLDSGPLTYKVLATNVSTQSLTVYRNDLVSSNTCPVLVYNDTFDLNILRYSSDVRNLRLFYGCTSVIGISPANIFPCTTNGTDSDSFFATSPAPDFDTDLVSCNSNIVVRVSQGLNLGNFSLLSEGILGGFGLQWEANNTNCSNCNQSGGRCGYNLDSDSFACYCSDRPYDLTCNDSSPNDSRSGSSNSLQIILPVVGAVIAGVALGWLVFYCRQRRKKHTVNHLSSIDKKEHPTIPLTNTDLNTPSSIASTISTTSSSYASSKTTEVGRYNSYFGAKIFTYNELEEATANFDRTRELGDGGFGAVYYGVLPDGSVVAVKRLYENNYKRVEQFMNEVEILRRLRHPHLVTLYGCTSKQSKELLLVYEYIPNGTIADHLQGKRSDSGLLSWPIRLNIAIETAEALAYLHASDIIHRDVKSNNILLDNDFHVKVADFGLSRLFPNNVTHVSTAPQGTPGYVDPEYYQVYQLTEKSDVYSFGVVLMELISSLPAVDITRHRHDINLANMAVNKIQNQTLHEMVDPNLQFEANSTIKRMITLVAELAFRCLQQEKGMRPSMQEVLDALRGIQKTEVVGILVDDGRLLKDETSPPSPDSVTYKWISGSTRSSSG